jgi:hypothetical protein
MGRITNWRGDCVITAAGRSVATMRVVWDQEEAARPPRAPAPPTGSAESVQRLIDPTEGRVWFIEDEPGHRIARITYLVDRLDQGAYIVELESGVNEPLRTIATTTCLFADNRLIHHRHGE